MSESFRANSVESFQARLSDWFDQYNSGSIQLTENLQPTDVPFESYRIVYTATFTPDNLAQALVHVSLESDGFVGIGLETYARMNTRLNLRESKSSLRYLAGFEPALKDHNDLFPLLDIIAGGQFTAKLISLPIFGIVSARILFDDKDYARCIEGKDFERYNSRFSKDSKSNRIGKVLTFRSWRHSF